MFCITLCGPRTKKFGDPWLSVLYSSESLTAYPSFGQKGFAPINREGKVAPGNFEKRSFK